MPGRVESYDVATQKADVKPLLMRGVLTGDGEDVVQSLPVIPGVPIVFPRAGGFYVSFPVEPGDHVLLVFCERSIDKWATSEAGGDTDPIDLRTHALADAVAIPGCYPFQKSVQAHATDMVLGKDGSAKVHLKPSGEVHLGVENPPEFVALAAKVLTELTKLKLAHDTHTHVVAGVTAGPASVVSALPIPLVVPLVQPAATKVKAL